MDDGKNSTDKPRQAAADDVAQGLQKVLDRHGYGFHYAAIERCAERYPNNSPWRFVVSEFPVRVRNQDTRIDFILRHRKRPYLLLVECKNANPALSDWCFVKAPYVRRNRMSEEREILTERLYRGNGRNCYAGMATPFTSNRVYELAFEIKSNKKGNPASKGRGQIERAATQVCRGIGGLAEAYNENLPMIEKDSEIHLFSAIFTTAKIWTSDVDLTDTDLATGTLGRDGTPVEQKDWVWYQYHQSPGLTNTLPRRNSARSVENLLGARYARTIAVVSASGIDSFLDSDYYWPNW